MLIRTVVDYTNILLGTKTENGAIGICPKCGRQGAFRKFTSPLYSTETEIWLHRTQVYRDPQNPIAVKSGPDDECMHITGILAGKSITEWSYSDRIEM